MHQYIPIILIDIYGKQMLIIHHIAAFHLGCFWNISISPTRGTVSRYKEHCVYHWEILGLVSGYCTTGRNRNKMFAL